MSGWTMGLSSKAAVGQGRRGGVRRRGAVGNGIGMGVGEACERDFERQMRQGSKQRRMARGIGVTGCMSGLMPGYEWENAEQTRRNKGSSIQLYSPLCMV